LQTQVMQDVCSAVIGIQVIQIQQRAHAALPK